jgi:hypothetical protein
MRARRIFVFVATVALALFFCPAANVVAQRTGSSSLVVTVAPEAHFIPPQIPLRFTVSADGATDVIRQSANVSAWVRALPGQQIHVTAHLGTVTGPSGTLPSSAIAWTGSVSRATAGGQAATCTSGSFTSGATQDLVAGWRSSGTLTCALTFSLSNPRSLPPGLYTATIDL